MKVLVLHGPNLNLLGEREPQIYGRQTLKDINLLIKKWGKKNKVSFKFFQSNCEGCLIDFIHSNRKWAQGMVVNPGAYTHYSYALRDAVAAMTFPTVEVHLSDIKKREKFRRHSVIAPVCVSQVSGLKGHSYIKGLEILISKVKNGRK